MTACKSIIIFASGTGSNAEAIIRYFNNNSSINIEAVFSNNAHAEVLEKAQKMGVNRFVFNNNQLTNSSDVLKQLVQLSPNLVVLAGFLKKIPQNIIEAFPNKIINIHPALLPKYGGKGMYGQNIHRAVVQNQESESGISIHYVNKNYDEGGLIFQAKCSLSENETPESLSEKVRVLEHTHYPLIIEKILNNDI